MSRWFSPLNPGQSSVIVLVPDFFYHVAKKPVSVKAPEIDRVVSLAVGFEVMYEVTVNTHS